VGPDPDGVGLLASGSRADHDRRRPLTLTTSSPVDPDPAISRGVAPYSATGAGSGTDQATGSVSHRQGPAGSPRAAIVVKQGQDGRRRPDSAGEPDKATGRPAGKPSGRPTAAPTPLGPDIPAKRSSPATGPDFWRPAPVQRTGDREPRGTGSRGSGRSGQRFLVRLAFGPIKPELTASLWTHPIPAIASAPDRNSCTAPSVASGSRSSRRVLSGCIAAARARRRLSR
jgi:hypothetical protein